MTARAGVMLSDAMGEVYFIQSGERSFVKIGWALDPPARLSQLQCGNPDTLRLLATIPGMLADELAWQVRFAHLSARNEWFHLTQEMVEAISNRNAIAAAIWAERHPEVGEPDQIDRWCAMIRASRLASVRRGSMAPNTNLDEAKVAAIRSDRRCVRAIAAAYGIGKTTVQDIRMRKTWRHVA